MEPIRQVRCPHCSGTERIRTARQVHEGPPDPSADLRRELLGPPPAPREPAAAPLARFSTASKLFAALAGLSILGSLKALLFPPADLGGYDESYAWGYQYGGFMVAGFFLVLALTFIQPGVPKTRRPELDAYLAYRSLWTERMQVWEFAGSASTAGVRSIRRGCSGPTYPPRR